jgi:hypothetical protein
MKEEEEEATQNDRQFSDRISSNFCATSRDVAGDMAICHLA